MTLKEYLNEEIEDSMVLMYESDNMEGKSYFEGKADALGELIRKLPELEHEVTLREVKEKCLKGCYGCPFAVVDIQKRMKEARRD